MQPKMCCKCKKNVAVIFITKVENGVTLNEGYCIKCARTLGIPQIDQAVKQMGISEEDLDMISDEMSSMFGQKDDSEGESDEVDSQTATFPLMNQLFGGGFPKPAKQPENAETKEKEPKKEKKSKHKFLDNYCMDLTARAREGKLDKVIGRDVETERVIQILNRRQKNNPCLVGEPGVGKTAIAEGLAQRIVAGDVPYKLRDKEVFLLDLTALVAGTQFRGQFESRMKSLITEIKACGNIILVIDEVHNLVGAGDAEGSMNAANILKPPLSRGEIQVIGATTFNEYRKYIEKDAALERRFQPVTVAEPTIEEACQIMQGISKTYAQFHGVSISPEIARQCVILSERYITDRFLPDKAIDLLDEACSDVNLRSKEISKLAELKKERDDYELELKMLNEDTENTDFERLATIRSKLCQTPRGTYDEPRPPLPVQLAGAAALLAAHPVAAPAALFLLPVRQRGAGKERCGGPAQGQHPDAPQRLHHPARAGVPVYRPAAGAAPAPADGAGRGGERGWRVHRAGPRHGKKPGAPGAALALRLDFSGVFGRSCAENRCVQKQF